MRLERFGEYEFSTISAEDRLGEAVSPSDLIRTAAGAFDPNVLFESEADPFIVPRTMEIFGDTPADLQVKLDAVRSMRGKRRKLYARTYDGHVRWVWARCIKTPYLRSNRNFYHQALEAQFEIEALPWKGHIHKQWEFDSGEDFDDALYFDEPYPVQSINPPATLPYYTLANGGNARITDAIVKLTAGTEDITYFSLYKDEDDGIKTVVEFTGTVPAGELLIIDCGAASVTVDGDDAYDDFELATDHNNDDWLEIRADETYQINFTVTGGGVDSTIAIEFADGWK